MRINRDLGTGSIQAPAKVNLFLEVLGKRPDGYHDLCTLLVAIDLFDSLEFERLSDGVISLTCDDPRVPTGEGNLMVQAARRLKEVSKSPLGVRMSLRKRIPMQAGLGGGSSDAAATLRVLNELWDLRLSKEQLQNVASDLGSDVPFFLDGPAAWCTGRGEKVSQTSLNITLHLVLICPSVGLPTGEVFRRVRVPHEPVAPSAMEQALQRGDLAGVGAALHNRLQEAAEELAPGLRSVREVLESLGPLGHQMSGSGSSYFALCRDQQEAEALAEKARAALDQKSDQRGGYAYQVFVTHSLTQG
jgi:4-diphosphocytidyl-2-C-methyl-D-erythritol kinase